MQSGSGAASATALAKLRHLLATLFPRCRLTDEITALRARAIAMSEHRRPSPPASTTWPRRRGARLRSRTVVPWTRRRRRRGRGRAAGTATAEACRSRPGTHPRPCHLAPLLTSYPTRRPERERVKRERGRGLCDRRRRGREGRRSRRRAGASAWRARCCRGDT